MAKRSLDDIMSPLAKSSTGFSHLSEASPSSLLQMLNEESDTEDYSAFRSGAVELLEGAIGAGDELDAMLRRLSGDADTWDEAINASRADLKRFGNENPLTSTLLTGTGLAAGLFIPGAGMAKIAQAGTTAQRAMKAGALTAAEGSVYGFLSGEGEEGRLTGAALGAGVGGVLGGASSALLTKGVPTKIEKGDGAGSHMGGDNGFNKDVPLVKESGGTARNKNETSAGARTVRSVETGDAGETLKHTNAFWSSIFLSTEEWLGKFVGQRAGKLAADAEREISVDSQALEETLDTVLRPAFDLLERDEGLRTLSLRMNPSINKKERVTWTQLKNATKSPEDRAAIEAVEEQIRLLQRDDPLAQFDVDYFPTLRKPGYDTVKGAKSGEYVNSIVAVRDFAQDVSAAKILANKFGIDFKSIKKPKKNSKLSRMDLVINEIQAEAKKQGASVAVSKNLGNGLRSQFIAAQQGGNTLGALARRATSTALLANPLNAVLNMAEGITAPIYQNGIIDWSKNLPGAILSTFSKTAGQNNKNWISQKELGLDNDFMGELASAGKQAFNEAAETVSVFTVPVKYHKAATLVDEGSKALYKYSGVSTVNRMGQEMLANTAVKRGIKLAKAGDEKALAKLRKHDGMRGLTDREFKATVDALKTGKVTDPWVLNFAGASLNKWQPISAATLPKAFHDNPNARVMYSMLSYMNRQMNGIRTDVGLNMLKAKDLGINSKEGAAAMREAMKNSAKYAGIFGVFAGIWDDFRMTLDQSKEDKTLAKLFTPDGISNAFLNQLGSNLSAGIVNVRSEEFGGKPIEPIPAPISAGFRLGSGIYDTSKNLLTGESDPFNPLLKATQTYVPGFSNIDRIVRMGTGKRLLTDD